MYLFLERQPHALVGSHGFSKYRRDGKNGEEEPRQMQSREYRKSCREATKAQWDRDDEIALSGAPQLVFLLGRPSRPVPLVNFGTGGSTDAAISVPEIHSLLQLLMGTTALAGV